MLDNTYIKTTLKQLTALYDKAIHQKGQQELLYSKLILLEICGWIEETMDDMILQIAQKTLKEKENKDYIKQMIEKNHGFDYDRNFRKMLISVIGIVSVEKLERQLKQKIFIQFKSTLKILKHRRNAAAHTHIQGTMKHRDAPSVLQKYFDEVCSGLQDIEKKIIVLGFLDT